MSFFRRLMCIERVPLEAGRRPVRHQIVETTVAHLQQRAHADPQAPSVATIVSSREPPASAAIESSRHTSNQRTFASSHIDGER